MKNDSKTREESRHLPWPGKQSISIQSVHRVYGFISIISGNTWNISMHILSWLWAYHRGSKLSHTSTGEMNVETHSLSPENSKYLKTMCNAKSPAQNWSERLSTCCKIYLQKLNKITRKSKFDLQTKTTSQLSIIMTIQLWNKNASWEEVYVWIELTTKEKVELEYSINFQVNWCLSRALQTTRSWRWCRTEQISGDVKVEDAKITVPVDLQKSVIHRWSASSLWSGQGQMGPGTGS